MRIGIRVRVGIRGWSSGGMRNAQTVEVADLLRCQGRGRVRVTVGVRVVVGVRVGVWVVVEGVRLES